MNQLFKNSLVIAICMLPLFSVAQYKYELELSSFNESSPKQAYSFISQKLTYGKRSIENNRFYFESSELYSEEKINQIVTFFDYELKSFQILARPEEEQE